MEKDGNATNFKDVDWDLLSSLYIFFMIICLNTPTASRSLHADPEEGGRAIF
jgi:hypothetical protein